MCWTVLIDIVSAFPKMFTSVFGESMIKRALEKGLVKINLHDLRDFTYDRQRKVDDYPFGGGPGMVMKPEPFFRAVYFLQEQEGKKQNSKIVLMSPQGKLLKQEKVKEISKLDHIIVLCGHYEGVDERVREFLAEEEISIGDYILTGGELPAMVLIDATIRLVPGVLSTTSLQEESFSGSLLEYPQYTRPRQYQGMGVPDILLSGDHGRIKEWRRKQSLVRTSECRPELLDKEGNNNELS